MTHDPSVKQTVLRLKAEGLSNSEIGRQLSINRGTVADWVGKGGLSSTPSLPREPALEKQVRDLKSRLTLITEQNLTAESVRREIFKLSELTPMPPSWVPKIKTIRDSGTPMAVLSDVHWGEVVNAAALNGINEYNIDIAKKRLFLWAEKIIALSFDSKHPDYPGLVLPLGGDMMTGDIHDELKETNEMPMFPALLELLEVLMTIIRMFKKEFKRVYIPCTFGNHGRNTKQVRFKHRAHSNFDWLLSCLLEKYLADPDIVFSIPTSTDTYYTVQGRKFLLNHGDTIGARGGDGIIGPLGPIKRGENKLRRMSEWMNMGFDHLVHGHYHIQMMLGRTISNGCVIGYNEYAKDELRAEPEPPQQTLAFIHENYGVIKYQPVLLSEETKRMEVPRGGDFLNLQAGGRSDRKPSSRPLGQL